MDWLMSGFRSTGFEKYYRWCFFSCLVFFFFFWHQSKGTKVMLSLRVLSLGRNIFLDLWAMFESSVAALPPLGDQLSQDQLTHHSFTWLVRLSI